MKDSGLGCLIPPLVAVIVVFFCVRADSKADRAFDTQRKTVTTVEATDGLLYINNIANYDEPCYRDIQRDVVVNPDCIVSFENWSSKFYKDSCEIKLSSGHIAGKSGYHFDILLLKGISRQAMIDKFTEARKQRIPEAK